MWVDEAEYGASYDMIRAGRRSLDRLQTVSTLLNGEEQILQKKVVIDRDCFSML